jgi:hypothetical protein
MKRATLLVSALAVVLYTIGMSAQAPSFAGKWTLQVDPAAAPPAGGGGGGGGRGGGRGGGPVSGMDVTIMQDATTLTINKTQGQNAVTLKYTLDGKDSKNTTMGRGGEVVQTSQAVMAAGKLTITTTADMGRGPTTTKQVISMDGGNLTVENMGADGTSMGKLTYKKAM